METFEPTNYTWRVHSVQFLHNIMTNYGCPVLETKVRRMAEVPFDLEVILVWDGRKYYIAKIVRASRRG